MISGVVNSRNEATLPLRLRGPDGDEFSATAVVDSGFTASLTLPEVIIAALGLTLQSAGSAILGDGTVRTFDVYDSEVWWGDSWRPVLVSAVGEEALLGMRMLAGHRIRVDVVPGGVVEVTPLDSPTESATRHDAS